jgi:hypothetical protein
VGDITERLKANSGSDPKEGCAAGCPDPASS